MTALPDPASAASVRRRPRSGRRVVVAMDRTRERTAALNQLLLAGVVLLPTLVVVAGGFPGSFARFFIGVAIVFVATAATFLAPWNRLPLAWMALIPAVDIVAIVFLRLSSPESGFGLLWVFPAMWLGASFGVVGLVAGIVSTSAAFWATLAIQPPASISYSTILLPLVIIAVAGTSYLTARRAAAQRVLLDKQARLLGLSLERARRQEQSVTEVLDAVDFGVIRIGADGRTTVTNDAHGRLQSQTEVSGDATPFREDGTTPLPVEELPLVRARNGEAFDGQLVWFGDPAATRRALSVTARRVTDVDGADAGAVVVSRDVTAELTALRARDALVASVSHELRTPLTSILGYLDLALEEPGVPGAARKSLEIAERNAERLLGIVADILAASSASRSVELTIRPADIALEEIIRAAVEAAQPRARSRAVSIDVSGVEPARAWVDPLRVRQVLDNLLANAVAYNRDGGKITIGCATEGDSTWIVVRDTGIGMTGEEAAGLFEPFYRAASIRKKGIRGTGLGLSITRDIVRAHGGEITVRSSPGVGTTFLVRLPAVREAASPAPRLTDPLAAEPAADTAAAAEEGSPS